MLKLILLEFQKLKRSKILYIVICTTFLFYLCAAAQGIKASYAAQRLMDETLMYATFLMVPALFALLGSYVISREKIDDTAKNLAMIPINFEKLTYAKLLTAQIIGIIMFLLLFLFSVLSVLMVDMPGISARFVLINLKSFLLQGIGCFVAVSPIIVFLPLLKNGHWLAAIVGEIYSFTGLIAASSRFWTIYPVSALSGLSGIRSTNGYEFAVCLCSLAITAAVAFVLLKLQRKQNL